MCMNILTVYNSCPAGGPERGEQMLHLENSPPAQKGKKQKILIGLLTKANASAFQQNLQRTMIIASSASGILGHIKARQGQRMGRIAVF